MATKDIYSDPQQILTAVINMTMYLFMPTKEVGRDASDPSFEPGFKSLMKYKLNDAEYEVSLMFLRIEFAPF